MKNRFELIITIINAGFSDEVMRSAKQAGAGGGTVLHARGTGDSDIAKMFGVVIQPEKEFVMIIVQSPEKEAVMKAIAKGAGLTTDAQGIVFSMPVDDTLGIFTKAVRKSAEETKNADSDDQTSKA